MPRPIESALEYCLDRENPRVETYAEISAPDVGRVLRRHADQLLLAPDPLVSLAPASSLVSAPSGGVAIASTPTTLVSFFAAAVNAMNVDQEDSTKRLKGVLWSVDPAFERALLRSFTARLTRSNVAYLGGFELQVYRATGRPGVLTKPDGTRRSFWQWDFVPLLASPVAVLPHNVAWVANVADVVFDLTGQNLYVDGSRGQLPSSQFNGLTNYYFSVRQTNANVAGVQWFTDNVSARTIAGIGSFDQSWWTRNNPGDAWAQQLFGQVPRCSIQIEQYAPAGGQAQAVYKIEQRDAVGTLRAPSAGTTGRVVVAGAVPKGTTLTAELSSAGSGGPWTPVVDGKELALIGVPAQQLYHMRVTLTPSASQRATPILAAVGVEFRTPVDVSREMIVAPLSRDINVPFLAATVGDGSIRVLRTGRRDYRDAATTLGSTQPATKLEADIWLRSSHPNVTRDKWLRLDRAAVVDRAPDELGETFQLLSFLTMMQREIPLPQESINTVHTVQGSPSPTPLAFVVSPNLQGATVGGSEYTGKNYYIRSRREPNAPAPAVPEGAVALIASQTNANQINVNSGDLQTAPNAGDKFEVHSGTLNAGDFSYKDQDPADVWWAILTDKLQIPPERIGLGHLPRGGKPPTVTDRAPGDAATQAKYKISLALDKAEKGIELVDQVSFLLGGATVEIAGQLCFVQIYPLRDGAGNISVPLPASSRTFDPRDYFNQKFPQGLAQQQAAVKCGYGVDLTVPEALRGPAAQTEVADSDAINWLTLSPTDNRGRTQIPDEIARWCYNSADAGLLLATEAAHQVVAYCATGMRPWQWNTRDAWPQHHAGDVVTVITDQYTDYDPSGLVSISGWMAINVVLLGVSADGRQFRGIVPGINRNAARRVGGQPATGGTGGLGVPCPLITVDEKSVNKLFMPSPVLNVVFVAPSDANFDGLELTIQTDGDATTISHVAKTMASPIRLFGAWDTTYLITPVAVARNGVRTVGVPVTHTTPQGNKIKRDLPMMKSDGTGAADGYTAKAIDTDGQQLTAAITVENPATVGSSVRIARNGQEGVCRHAVAVSYPVLFNGTPMTELRGGIITEPRATAWGTATQVDANSPSGVYTGYGAKLANTPEYEELIALNAGPGSFTPRLRLRQKANPVPQSYDFSGVSATVAGATDNSAVIAAGASANDEYRIRGQLVLTARAGAGSPFVGVAATYRILSVVGGFPTERFRATISVSDTTGITQTSTTPIDQTLAQSGMGATDYWQFELLTVTKTGTGTTTQSLRGRKNSIDGFTGVNYNTSTGDKFASKTPDLDDSCIWQSKEVS